PLLSARRRHASHARLPGRHAPAALLAPHRGHRGGRPAARRARQPRLRQPRRGDGRRVGRRDARLLMDRIRVATLNIWNRMGPWEERLVAIRKEIERLQPDILGLQEVLVLPEHAFDQAKAIADGFGYHIAFGRSPDAEAYTLGNAILSRWPIARTLTYGLPGTDEHRSLVFAEIDAPNGKIPFFSTHLNWKFD